MALLRNKLGLERTPELPQHQPVSDTVHDGMLDIAGDGVELSCRLYHRTATELGLGRYILGSGN
jgi:hypothetical protein